MMLFCVAARNPVTNIVKTSFITAKDELTAVKRHLTKCNNDRISKGIKGNYELFYCKPTQEKVLEMSENSNVFKHMSFTSIKVKTNVRGLDLIIGYYNVNKTYGGLYQISAYSMHGETNSLINAELNKACALAETWIKEQDKRNHYSTVKNEKKRLAKANRDFEVNYD